MAKPKLVKTKIDDLIDELVKNPTIKYLQHGLLTVQIEYCIILKKTILKICVLEKQLKLVEIQNHRRLLVLQAMLQ